MRITRANKETPLRKTARTLKKSAGVAAMVLVGGGLTVSDSLEKSTVSPLWNKVLGPLKPSESQVASSAKAWGTVGAATGAAVGSYLATPLALMAVWAGTSKLGSLAQVAITGGAAAASFVFKPGRVLTGTVGGALGYVAGSAADRLGHEPSEKLGEATKGFQLGALPKRLLLNKNSTPSVKAQPAAKRALEQAQPGDIILAHKSDSHFLSVMTELGGGDGSYSHVGMVGSQGEVFEIRSGPAEARDRSEWEEYEKIAVLRPRYDSEESIKRTDNELRRLAQGAKYNLPFGLANLQSETDQYCGKLVQQSLAAGAPEVKVDPSPRLGLDMVLAQDFLESPDLDTVYESGTGFWEYHLKNFS